VIRFIQELKRRHVFRVAVVYGVVGWALVQVAATTFPHLGLPSWAVTLVIVLVLLGLAVALLLAWAFELTPDGLSRAAEGTPDPPGSVGPAAGRRVTEGLPNHRRAGWLRAGVIVVAAATLGVGLPLAFRGPATGDESPELSRVSSIAVLPFANLSGEAAADPFVSGLHHELLSQLARVSALEKVVPRTSVMMYAETPKRIPEIAMELGASLVLEAGVQHVGDMVRIHVLLVEGATERRLWSETYERELTVASLFEVQADIARRIAGELEAELTPEEERRIRALPTESLEAYDLYLRALAHGERWSEPEELFTAVTLLDRAVELDPGFVAAWARMSGWRYFLAWAHYRLEEAERADAALEMAVALDPDGAETIYAVAEHHYRRRNFEEALVGFERAERMQPNMTHGVRAMILRRLGRWEEALASLERQVEATPRWYDLLVSLGETNLRLRRFDDARRALDQAVAAASTRGRAHAYRVEVALARGDTTEARRIMESLRPNVDPTTRRRIEATVAFHARDYTRALEAWPREDPEDYARLAVVALRADDRPRALALADSLRTEAESLLRRVEEVGGPLSVNARVLGHTWRALAFAIHGREGAAREDAEIALRLVPPTVDQSTGIPTEEAVATVLVILGDLDGAVEQLAYLLSIPSLVSPGNLRVNPLYDPLQDHVGFRRLLRPT
jgi:TolB-like protein/Tfp pilus assembly protein PilF